MKRRTFLRQCSGWIGGAACVLPHATRARAGAAAPSNRITVGFIGIGRQAVFANFPGFLNADDAQAVAVCDVDAWRLADGKKRIEEFYSRQTASGVYRGCAAYGDFRELLARRDIDAVMISTPDHWHVPMAIAAVESGKDVCCEKPLTRSIREGRRLSDAVTRCQRAFRTDSEFRSIPDFRRACEIVRNGKIGRLHTIRAGVPATDVALGPQPESPVPEGLDYDFWLGPAPIAPYTEHRVHPRESYGRPGWMRVRDYCDGLILNWGAHLIDIAQWGNDTDRTGPVEVEASGEFPDPDGLWNVLLTFKAEYRYANGVRLLYESSTPYVRFEGDQGWVQVDYGKAIETSPASLAQWRPGPGEIQLPGKPDKRDFLDAVKSRKPSMEDAEVGHRTASVCHLGLIAAQTGRKLRWDPVAERFLDDAAANERLEGPPPRSPWGI